MSVFYDQELDGLLATVAERLERERGLALIVFAADFVRGELGPFVSARVVPAEHGTYNLVCRTCREKACVAE